MGTDIYILKVTHFFIKNFVYFIVDRKSRQTAIIDPVWDKKSILHILHEKGLQLTFILITHSHPDHIQLADALARTTGAVVHMSGIEIDFYDFDCYNLVPLDSHNTIRLGNTVITPIHSPGHTKGSLCYMTDNHIFTGDTLFIEGCGLCWGKGADPYEMYDTIQMLKKIIPPDMKVYPAHKYHREPGLSFQEVFNYNIYLDFRDKESFVKYRMRKNQRNLFSFK